MLKKRVAHNATNGSPKTAYHTKRTRRVVKYRTSVFIKNHTFQRVTRIKQPGVAGICTRLMDNEAKNNPSPIPGHPQNRHTLNGWANPKRIAKIFQCRRNQSGAGSGVPTLILNVLSSHPRHFHPSSPTFSLCHARLDRASSVFILSLPVFACLCLSPSSSTSTPVIPGILLLLSCPTRSGIQCLSPWPWSSSQYHKACP